MCVKAVFVLVVLFLHSYVVRYRVHMSMSILSTLSDKELDQSIIFISVIFLINSDPFECLSLERLLFRWAVLLL